MRHVGLIQTVSSLERTAVRVGLFALSDFSIDHIASEEEESDKRFEIAFLFDSPDPALGRPPTFVIAIEGERAYAHGSRRGRP